MVNLRMGSAEGTSDEPLGQQFNALAAAELELSADVIAELDTIGR